MRYRCIDRRRNQYPVSMMCRLLKVSSSGYYTWRVRAESQRSRTDRELTCEIRRLHADSDGVYGSRKITADLRYFAKLDSALSRTFRSVHQTRARPTSGRPQLLVFCYLGIRSARIFRERRLVLS